MYESLIAVLLLRTSLHSAITQSLSRTNGLFKYSLSCCYLCLAHRGMTVKVLFGKVDRIKSDSIWASCTSMQDLQDGCIGMYKVFVSVEVTVDLTVVYWEGKIIYILN